MDRIEEIKQIFGFKHELKDCQLECLNVFSKKRDLVAILPTGFGKSIVYQMTPYIAHGQKMLPFDQINCTTLIITPLNSIMKDQVFDLCKRGIKACAIDFRAQNALTYVPSMADLNLGGDTSSSSSDDDEEGQLDYVGVSLDRVAEGKYQLVYAHPEVFVSTEKGRTLLRKMKSIVVAIAVDEAHMILEW